MNDRSDIFSRCRKKSGLVNRAETIGLKVQAVYFVYLEVRSFKEDPTPRNNLHSCIYLSSRCLWGSNRLSALLSVRVG